LSISISPLISVLIISLVNNLRSSKRDFFYYKLRTAEHFFLNCGPFMALSLKPLYSRQYHEPWRHLGKKKLKFQALNFQLSVRLASYKLIQLKLAKLNKSLRIELWSTFYDLTKSYKIEQSILKGPALACPSPDHWSRNFEHSNTIPIDAAQAHLHAPVCVLVRQPRVGLASQSLPQKFFFL